jgi:hypothetical protein
MLMPVLPFVSDTVAHTFWLYEHISTVHYEDGNYHTHYEAAAIATKTNTDKDNTAAKYTSNADDHEVNTASYHHATSHTVITTSFSPYQVNPYNTHLLSDYPPPKA